MKHTSLLLILVVVIIGLPILILAQYGGVTLTAALHPQAPSAQSLQAGVTYADVARITLTASNGDVVFNGIYLGTDISGGLNNFTNLYVYDVTTTITLIDTYPGFSENPNLLEFPNRTIGNGQSKTYLIRASLSSSASGQVRVGFTGFTYPSQTPPNLVNVPIYGNVMTLPGAVPTPIPTSMPTPTPSTLPAGGSTPNSLGFTSLSVLNLNEGDVINSVSAGDPDVYIVNTWGYKRLFLNPVVFGFYGHLSFSGVKNIALSSRNMLVPSGLFRNCELNDPKVYGLETTGEDSGVLHWVNTSGEQAVADDPEFFKKVFCINNNEFNWYAKGSAYTSVNQVPSYSR